MNATLQAALLYASKGFHVFPIIKGTKKPETAHGFKDATNDITQIHLWWNVREGDTPPDIAIATGNQYGLAIFDVDPRNGGTDSLEALRRDGIQLPSTPQVITGGGGSHFYFSIAKGIEFKGRSAIRPGLDLKSDLGYCVAPPSAHSSGRNYVWELSADLDTPMAAIPDALLKIIQEKDAPVLVPGTQKPAPKRLPDAYGDGERHKYLLSVLGLLRRKNLSQGAAIAAIREENRIKCKPPVEDHELVALVGDVFKRWQAQEAVKIVGENAQIKVLPDDGLTDLGNANAFVKKFGDRILFSFKESGWFAFDSKRWERRAVGYAERAAQTIPVDLHSQAKRLEQDAIKAQKENRQDDAANLSAKATHIAAWAKKSESRDHISAILKLAAPMLEIDAELFDAKPFLLNFNNGTVDVTTGILHAHKKADMITMMINLDYDENAKSPYFYAFLLSIMGGDSSKADALLRCLGYSITGSVKEQVLFCCYGPTSANGKSKLFDCIREVLGEYACCAPDGLLEETNNDKHPTQVACLKGRRFVSTVETGAGKRMAENLVKKLTGGDRLTARRMREDFSEFDPTHHLWIASNHRLRINLDPSVLRRIVEFPFDVHFWDAKKGESGPEHLRQDPDVADKLRAEMPGIIVALVKGCMDYMKNGLALPNDILKSLDDYKAEMDTVQEWIGDRCVVVAGAMTSATDLFKDFATWCERNRKSRLSQVSFTVQMATKGFVKEKGHKDRMYFQGIGLNSQQFDDAPKEEEYRP